VLLMKNGSISHDTIPGFYERFESAYILQLQNFIQNLLQNRKAPITCDDGIAAQKIALAATTSANENRVMTV
jgi:scyllo-inositol 2-dehydrogenase (NAD+)